MSRIKFFIQRRGFEILTYSKFEFYAVLVGKYAEQCEILRERKYSRLDQYSRRRTIYISCLPAR